MANLPNGSNGGFEPGLSRLRVRHSTTEPARSTKVIIQLYAVSPTGCVPGFSNDDLTCSCLNLHADIIKLRRPSHSSVGWLATKRTTYSTLLMQEQWFHWNRCLPDAYKPPDVCYNVLETGFKFSIFAVSCHVISIAFLVHGVIPIPWILAL